MENREREVLQRVFARQEEPPRGGLREMMAAAVELISVYRQLQEGAVGQRKEKLRRLQEGEMANLQALKGISVLSGGGEEVLKLWQSVKEPERKLLIRCYHRTRRCMVDYMARSAEAEFGTVFRSLADREERNCTILAELLGGK